MDIKVRSYSNNNNAGDHYCQNVPPDSTIGPAAPSAVTAEENGSSSGASGGESGMANGGMMANGSGVVATNSGIPAADKVTLLGKEVLVGGTDAASDGAVTSARVIATAGVVSSNGVMANGSGHSDLTPRGSQGLRRPVPWDTGADDAVAHQQFPQQQQRLSHKRDGRPRPSSARQAGQVCLRLPLQYFELSLMSRQSRVSAYPHSCVSNLHLTVHIYVMSPGDSIFGGSTCVRM